MQDSRKQRLNNNPRKRRDWPQEQPEPVQEALLTKPKVLQESHRKSQPSWMSSSAYSKLKQEKHKKACNSLPRKIEDRTSLLTRMKKTSTMTIRRTLISK